MVPNEAKSEEDAASPSNHSPLNVYSHPHHPPNILIQTAVQKAIKMSQVQVMSLKNSLMILLMLTIVLATAGGVTILYIRARRQKLLSKVRHQE